MSMSSSKRAAAAVVALPLLVGAAVLLTGQPPAAAAPEDRPPQRPLRVDPPHVSTDRTVTYDYDIVYVRAPRTVKGGDGQDRPAPVWPDPARRALAGQALAGQSPARAAPAPPALARRGFPR